LLRVERRVGGGQIGIELDHKIIPGEGTLNHGWTRINTDDEKEGLNKTMLSRRPFELKKFTSVFIQLSVFIRVHPWFQFESWSSQHRLRCSEGLRRPSEARRRLK